MLKQAFGDQIDLFGRGIQEVEDKWDAVAQYKYHVALENCCVKDYWTEKLSDAFLAGCYPIYYGCPNIDRYFSSLALSKIDISEPDKALRIIELCIKEQKYESAKRSIQEARIDVLNKYNVFPMICRHIEHDQGKLDGARFVKIRIRPQSSRSFGVVMRSVFHSLRSRVFNCLGVKWRG